MPDRRLRGWLALRFSPISCVEQSRLVGFYLDTQAFAASAVEVDGLQLAALDLVQHGLAADAEGFGSLVEVEPAFGFPAAGFCRAGPGRCGYAMGRRG